MSIEFAPENFTHIIRLLNTNVDGKRKVAYAFRMIKGIGPRFAFLVCKKAGIDHNRRAGTLSPAEVEKISDVIADPQKFKIPTWFLNRQRDQKTGKTEHIVSNTVDIKLREDLERMKKMYQHRGIRHALGLRVRGQHTCNVGKRTNKIQDIMGRK